MPDIAELGLVVDSSQLKAANEQLTALPGAAGKAEGATKTLNNEFTKGGGAVSAFMAKLTETKNELLGGFKTALVQTAASLGLTFGGVELIRKLGETVEGIDAVSKAARAVGSSVEAMQALGIAGNLAGIGIDAVEMSTKRMNRALGAAIAAGKENDGVFKRLGISATTLAAMPVDQRFAAIADKMQKLHFNTADTTAALALLGDRTGALVGLLGQGGDAIRKASGDLVKFNMALTDSQGKNVEELQDSFIRLGYSIQGAFDQFVATIAPALSLAVNNVASGIALIVKNAALLIPVLTVLSPIFAVMFGAGVVAAITSIATLIGKTLVGAFQILTVVMRANPLVFFATLLAVAIAAIWVFRDNIKSAIGLDVQKIFHDVINFIIQRFMSAIETLKLIWNDFPSMVGSAAIGATNLVIKALNFMIGGAVQGINNLISLVQQIPGMDQVVKKLNADTGQIGLMADPNAASNAWKANLTAMNIAIIDQTDYVKKMGDAWGAATKQTEVATVANGAAGSVLEGVNKTVKKVKPTVDAATKAFNALKTALKDSATSAFQTFFSDLEKGTSIIGSLTDALGDLANKLLDIVSNNISTGLISALFPSTTGSAWVPGGWGSSAFASKNGNVFQSSGLHQYANSVVTSPTVFPFAKGVGLMGEAGPEAVMPLKKGPGGVLGVAVNDNGGGSRPIIIQPIIYNNAANDVTATTKQDQNGNLIVQIDKAVAQLVNKPGSQTSRAIKTHYGLQTATLKRS